MIRNISSIDKETGSITIGESITEGQIVQFHLRDSGAAQEELKKMLSEYENKNGEIVVSREKARRAKSWKKMEKSLAKQGRSPFNLTNFFIVLRGLYEFF